MHICSKPGDLPQMFPVEYIHYTIRKAYPLMTPGNECPLMTTDRYELSFA